MSQDACFSLRDASFAYHRDKNALERVTADFVRGEFHALIGPNGAGKSTLLGLLSGRLAPTAGEVFFRGKPVADWPRREFARQVAVVPQREESLFDFTVREVVLMGRFPFQRGPFALETASDHEVVQQALEETDLVGLADRPIGSLSGGERQRSLVARALAQEPSVLLLDEPNSALDPRHQHSILDLMRRLNRDLGRTILFVTHDLSLAGAFSRFTWVLNSGRVVHQGPTESIIESDLLSRVYQTGIAVERRGDGAVLVGLLP
ncbi:MAG: ABC transporter ATP-binding protein [Candidatus Omnitrophica bacterium]|nr:Ferric enterobactin transport ATP-binding protein FepC [bacterium]NUN95150.1 ABC transporter ATP-binding protein [Candidatus Omnitrophota bacterium]